MRSLKTCSFNLLLKSGLIAMAGSVYPEDSAPEQLIDFANEGREIGGERLATWLQSAEQEPKERPPEGFGDLAPAEQASEIAELVLATEPALATLIKAMVRAGESKTAAVKEIGSSEDYTQDAVRAEFDRLLGTGEIVAGDKPGEYSVT